MNSSQKIILIIVAAVVLSTVASVLAANLGVLGTQVANSDFAKWGTGAVLAEIIAMFIFIGKKVWGPQSTLSIQILPAPEFPGLRPGRIRWNNDKCFIKSNNIHEQVRLVNSGVGQAWKVHIGNKIMEKIADSEYIEFSFEDDRGNLWAAGPFLKYEYTLSLSCLDVEQVKSRYASADQ